MTDKQIEWTGVDSDIAFFSSREEEHGWRSPMKVIRQLLKANKEELERRKKAEALLKEGIILLEQGVLLVHRRRNKELILGFLFGFCVAYMLVEGLRWLLS